MKKNLFPIIFLLAFPFVSSAFMVYNGYGYGVGGWGTLLMCLLGLISLIVGSFIFSVIFWWVHKVFEKK